MRLSKHIRLAFFTGLLVGILVGIIDSISRIIALSFEWFEIYQNILISLIVFILGFVFLGFLIELARVFIKFNINLKKLYVFYAISSITLLLLFYGGAVMKILLSKHFTLAESLDNPIFILFVLTMFLIVGFFYIFLLIKGKKFIFKTIQILKKRKIRGFTHNFIFIVIIFIIMCFILDVYLLKNISVPISRFDLKGYPNIIIITLDTVRADHLSLYDYPLNTSPNLKKFAKNSIVFTNAVSPSSWTLPSHASIFTGKYPSHHNAIARHQELDENELTLAEILQRKGYITVGFIGGPYSKAKYGISQGFMDYRDRLDFFGSRHTFASFSIRPIIDLLFPNFDRAILNSDGEQSSEELNKKIFKWLDKNKYPPFFMFINYFDAHDPYDLGKEFRKYFTNETKEYAEVQRMIDIKRYSNVSMNTVEYMIKLYDTEIFYLDHHLAKLFNKLDELGIKNNTIIVITSDHGEEFYEHGGFMHGQTLYEELIHVPLLIYYPKEFEAQRIDERVSTTDIFSTVLDIINIKPPKNVDSISLLPLINDEDGPKRTYVLSELYGREGVEETKQQKSISDNNWKLIEVIQWRDDVPNAAPIPSGLFDLRTDKKEKNNTYYSNRDKRELLKKIMINITSRSRSLNDLIPDRKINILLWNKNLYTQ